MVDLWKQQARAKINSHPSPRDDAVTALLKLTQYEEDNRKRKNYEDRGADTLLDGYTATEQIQQVASYFWDTKGDSGTSLRNLLAFLLSHYALMRGESVRMLELADLHSIPLENAGYNPCRALVMVMRQGKTNQVGRVEVGACMRHKNVRVCGHGMLAIYLFWRWHVDGEKFPDFTSSSCWYDLKLLKTGKDPTKPMSYKVHHDAISSALKYAGIRSKAKTHVGRGSGSRMADLGGASESQIRRLGRWNNQSMEKCYLTSLPREAMRTLAGFDSSRGSYFVARASAEPPHSDLNPSHPLWRHHIFQSHEFAQYKNQASAAISAMEDPADQRLQKAMSVLNAKLHSVHHDLKSYLEQIKATLRVVEGTVCGIKQIIEPLQSGSALLQVKLVQGSQVVATNRCTETLLQPVPRTDTDTDTTTSVTPVAPQYKMRRGFESVSELWSEWTVGVDGCTPVRELEQKYGTKWCDADERRFFNRRRKFLVLFKQW
ncbi:hypothetical protein F442_15373 [Phytophthora nicotianae P10297]|uniref:Ndc10 domain-containing protein n=1 Tax=Phytophthora nicotianae P10297 TaxID=1317064 RepID=W2YPM5_PHYNI|nr:hypothetical protein F442_15373 [Phytophthora nicotianae P10297]